jgi:hypothetical protein
MTDGIVACLITFPVVEFSSTISGVVVDTATVFEELSVPEKVVTDAAELRGIISILCNAASTVRTDNTID